MCSVFCGPGERTFSVFCVGRTEWIRIAAARCNRLNSMASRLTRRALGAAALGTAAALGQDTPPAAPYRGALEGFEDKVNLSDFDPVDWSRKRHEQAPLRLAFRAKNRKEAEQWQRRLRAKIGELIGGFPDRAGAPQAQLLETREFPQYTRQRLVFETRPGVSLLAYVLSPKTAAPHAAMICIPGHGRGVDDIVGIDEKGADRINKSGYQHDFAIQAVEHGMAAIAIEPVGFGCRRDPIAKRRGPGNSSCQPAAGAAMLLGETMIGWRVYDVMRTIDWIQTRKDLDASRIGCMGISGGGTITTFAAALDRRIQLAYISGYLCTFRDSILSLSHCIDNYVPGILNWAEMHDVAGLIAPRPLFAESGERDNIFPIAAAKESFARVRQIYEVFGAADKTGHEAFPGEHVFWGREGLPFAAKHLRVNRA
jgi:dienelactone hydrolase